ncbi:hypothetical protein ACIP5Y_14080 [Nocardia sp. NPDC088792]|uniref:hypothetical protein n=1 Tax=Nocardia sp. NPDC088792 TaxID=3364332 RepID=UPI00380791C5
MLAKLRRAAVIAGLGGTLVLTLATGTAAAGFGPLPPENPALGPTGTATMHGDSESSDTTPFAGPGAGPVDADFHEMGAACPTILQGADGLPQALCTKITNRAPTVFLLDPNTGNPLASLELTKGSLLGGVYAYLDDHDRLVTADGSQKLLRVGHDHGGPGGSWRLFVDTATDISDAVAGHCGGGACDHADSVSPDYQGRVWFATDEAAAGFVDPATGTARSILLAPGEIVANSISTAPRGMVVATDHALYLLNVDGDGNPRIVWRQAYDRGPYRKPGRLSWGTGATPVFFGPGDGTEYVTITDNAVPDDNLLVYDTATGRQICKVPAVDGTENAPIGSGDSVFVASTYGYPYPQLPPSAGPSVPPSAPITGGMTRIDVDAGGSGCHVVWTDTVPSSAVPRLSLADGKLYTFTRHATVPGGIAEVLDNYSYAVLDPATGTLESEQLVGATTAQDTLQMVGVIAPGRIQYQGTTTGFFRITPR